LIIPITHSQIAAERPGTNLSSRRQPVFGPANLSLRPQTCHRASNLPSRCLFGSSLLHSSSSQGPASPHQPKTRKAIVYSSARSAAQRTPKIHLISIEDTTQHEEDVHSVHARTYIIPLGGERSVITLPSITMRSLRPSILLAALLYATQVSLALHIEFPRSPEARLPNLVSRAPNATSTLDIVGTAYNINITLGGKQFSVQIDSGR
jgi:hypothetical protein